MQIIESYWPALRSGAPERTIGDALREAAKSWPDRLALIEGTAEETFRQWTFAELLAESESVAIGLAERFGPGSRIALWSTNSPEWLLLQFGAALAGLTLVTVNPAYREHELAYVLQQSRAAAAFVMPKLRSRDLVSIAQSATADLPQECEVLSLGDWGRIFRKTAIGEAALPEVSPMAPAQIQYTSGTTGFPKGALLAHRGLVLNGRSYATAIGAAVGDVWINPMPLFHTAGCVLATLGALQTGGCQVLPPAFDADLILDLFERHHGTILLSVPTMLIRILERQRQQPRDISSWRLSTLGGAPVPTELVREAESGFSLSVGIGFGQTEASPYITHTLPNDSHPRWFETVGRPLPDVEVKIARADGSVTGLGEQGEICTRGACVMLEYFENPAATADAIDSDGWLHTGDIGSMDEFGYVRVHGRIKDLIIRGGENIYPREVEEILFSHPHVVNVAVVGIPDPEWGEIVAAFVEASGQLDGDQLREYLTGRLATYKIPQVWKFVTSFPQTASGKIKKFALRDEYLAIIGRDA
jgi:fatty-acyl-CoA synthase